MGWGPLPGPHHFSASHPWQHCKMSAAICLLVYSGPSYGFLFISYLKGEVGTPTVALNGWRGEGEFWTWLHSGKQLGRAGTLLGKLEGMHWGLWEQESFRDVVKGPGTRKLTQERAN